MAIFPYDFYHFWAASRVALGGNNPYLIDPVYHEMLAVGWPPHEGFFGFFHPFWSLWLFAPFSLLPFPIALIVWEVALMCAIGWSIFSILRPSTREHLHIAAAHAPMVYGATLFPPVLSTLYHGQTNAFLLLGIVGWLRLTVSNSLFAAGAVLSLTALKPQLFLPFYFWVLLTQIKQRNLKVLSGFILGLSTQCLIVELFAPQAMQFWWQAVTTQLNTVLSLSTPSLSRILGQITGLPTSMSYVTMLVGVVLVLVTFSRTGGSSLWVGVGAALPISMLSAPYVWSHAFLALLPCYLTLLSRLLTDHPILTRYGIPLFCIFGTVAMLRPTTLDVYMLAIPLALLINYRHARDLPSKYQEVLGKA